MIYCTYLQPESKMVLKTHLLETYRLKARGDLKMRALPNVGLPHDLNHEAMSLMPLLSSVDAVRLSAQAPGLLLHILYKYPSAKLINRRL